MRFNSFPLHISSVLCILTLQATDGYSGSDLNQVVKESVVRKFRENINTKISKLHCIMCEHSLSECLYKKAEMHYTAIR